MFLQRKSTSTRYLNPFNSDYFPKALHQDVPVRVTMSVMCSFIAAALLFTTASSGKSLSVATQNLYWWNLFKQHHGGKFYNHFKKYGPFDLLLFQECDDVDQIKNGLGYDMSTYGPCHGVAMAWSNSRFKEISKGYKDVGEDRWDGPHYGKRCVVWARLRDTETNKVVFAASHHGPLGVDTGGLDGGYKVAQNINEVITKNMQSGDTVVLGGDFNAHSWGSTVKALRYNFGYNLRASSRIITKGGSNWMQLDHVFTKNGQGLDAKPEIKTISHWDTGSDHDGLKLTWSNGLSGGNGPAPNPSPAPAPGPAPANCGHTPSSCNSDLNWAANSGKYSHPEYYPNFKSVTGVELRSASWDDMVTYFACTHQVPYTL